VNTLGAGERAALLELARAAVEARVLDQPLPAPEFVSGVSAEPGAAFVSVYVGDDLRGCLGCIEPRGPSLAVAVVELAAAAASSDPRFAPLQRADLPRLRLEISVLGPVEPLANPSDVVIGRHGLIVEQEERRGLLLPQVAARWGWTVEQFLQETCRKAGLAASAWRTGARVFRFEADVFADCSAPGRERPVS
jgi:AmmeMemoRadiSam system protein A